ncbi:MAG: NACHT domain-containing protein [Cyanobacteria bacterium P01_F01_bin.150]
MPEFPINQVRSKFKLKDEYLEIVISKRKNSYGTIENWRGRAGASRTTAWRFEHQVPISFDVFDRLCDSLEFDYREVGEATSDSAGASSISALPISSQKDLNVLGVRKLVYKKIEHLCGKIQIFNRPVPISHYVELSIFRLDELLTERYGSREMLKDEFAFETYDRELGAIRNLERVRELTAVEEQYLLVYGWPGTGKTSYLKWLATECNEGRLYSDLVPVYLEAKKFASPEFDLIHCIADFFASYRIGNIQTVIKNLLQAGKIFLFIDGLDELHDAQAQAICQHIQDVVDQYFQCRYVFSCRLPLLLPFYRFQKLLINGFDKKQRQTFAENWFEYQGLDAEKLRNFLSNLKNHKALGELTRTPLLMELLCRVFQQYGEFPPTRADLYQKGINGLIYKDKNLQKYPFISHITRNDVWRFLHQIAMHYFTSQDEPMVLFDREDVLVRTQEFFIPIVQRNIDLEEANQLLENFELTYGLLVTHSANCCVFSHLTFQEYFTANFLAKKSQQKTVLKYITVPKWRFVIELVSELLHRDEKEYFFNQFKESVDAIVLNQKLKRFVRWLDCMAVEVLDTVGSSIAHKRTLLRAWYFSFSFQDADTLYNPGRMSGNFILPELNRVASYISSNTLKEHALFYKAYYATWNDNRYQEFERAVVTIHYSIQQQTNDSDDESLRLLRQLESWKDMINLRKAHYKHPERWWQAERNYWKTRVGDFIDKTYGLRTHWTFTEKEKQLLFEYYDASRLLSICTVRAGQRLSNKYRQTLADSLLSIPLQES